MKRNNRLLAGLLALLLLTGCTAPGSTSGSTSVPEPSVQSGDICYVPLDDRPDNLERVEYLANSLGYTLLLPEEDQFSTTLDGQPANAHGTQHGDRAALYEWVMAQEAAGCDRYILFMDQILSGGLVNSRAMTAPEDIVLSDGTTLTEIQLQAHLLTTLASDPENRVFLLDSVMRLAPTVGYQGGTLEQYEALRSYGMQPRPEIPADEPNLELVLDLYRKDSAGNAFSLDDFGLKASEVTAYLDARARKLELTDRMLMLLNHFGNQFYPDCSADRIRVLIGIDDSSAENSIQKNEITQLRSRLREGDALLSGVDDLAFKAVARLYLDECAVKVTPTASVEYFGGTEDLPACAYDSQPLDMIMGEHLAYFDMIRTEDPTSADIRVLVLTQPAEASQKKAYCRALIAALQECEKNKTPAILVDAGNGTYGSTFHEMLADDISLGQLISYSGFLDMAIVTGTAISHGIARYAWLANGNGSSPDANDAFCKTLVASLVLDLAYKNDVRLDVINKARKLGGDANNFYVPAIDLDVLNQTLSKGMASAAKPLLKNFSRSMLLTDTKGGAVQWEKVSLANWRFPWNRAFEVRMDIKIGE